MTLPDLWAEEDYRADFLRRKAAEYVKLRWPNLADEKHGQAVEYFVNEYNADLLARIDARSANYLYGRPDNAR